MRAHPTIHDVAEASGVSKSTVSNVVRGVGNVQPETRERVLQAIATLGYRPNALARNLVKRRTSTMGLVVGDLANPFYSELAKLVELRASHSGCTTMIANTNGRWESEQSQIESLLEQRVAGLLMLQFSGERAIIDETVAQSVPLVLLTTWDDRTDCVCIDDEQGAALATSHLVELGHRRVGYLSSVLVEPSVEQARFAGYRHALQSAGLEVPEDAVVHLTMPAYLRGAGAVPPALDRVLSSPHRPTAFFCANDLMAIELIDRLEERGLRVPGDVSVVGFDDIAVAGLRRISLTTVVQPTHQLARIGVETFMERSELGFASPWRQVRLEPTLAVRGSTGPP